MSHSESYDPVHGFFGLSYNPYLVVPRSILQHMPLDWQREFVKLLEELGQTEAGKEWNSHNYLVQRTCPETDVLIYEEFWDHYANDEEDEYMPTPPKFIPDPLKDYRHPKYRKNTP